MGVGQLSVMLGLGMVHTAAVTVTLLADTEHRRRAKAKEAPRVYAYQVLLTWSGTALFWAGAAMKLWYTLQVAEPGPTGPAERAIGWSLARMVDGTVSMWAMIALVLNVLIILAMLEDRIHALRRPMEHRVKDVTKVANRRGITGAIVSVTLCVPLYWDVRAFKREAFEKNYFHSEAEVRAFLAIVPGQQDVIRHRLTQCLTVESGLLPDAYSLKIMKTTTLRVTKDLRKTNKGRRRYNNSIFTTKYDFLPAFISTKTFRERRKLVFALVFALLTAALGAGTSWLLWLYRRQGALGAELGRGPRPASSRVLTLTSLLEVGQACWSRQLRQLNPDSVSSQDIEPHSLAFLVMLCIEDEALYFLIFEFYAWQA